MTLSAYACSRSLKPGFRRSECGAKYRAKLGWLELTTQTKHLPEADWVKPMTEELKNSEKE